MSENNPIDNTLENKINTYSEKAAKGFVWLASTSALWQVISWVFTILTARILMPSDYGIFALAATILPYMFLITSFNMITWYVQEETVDENIEKTFLTLAICTGLLTTIIFCFEY